MNLFNHLRHRLERKLLLRAVNEFVDLLAQVDVTDSDAFMARSQEMTCKQAVLSVLATARLPLSQLERLSRQEGLLDAVYQGLGGGKQLSSLSHEEYMQLAEVYLENRREV